MPTYKVMTPVRRGGKTHTDSIELSVAEAAPLLASGAVVDPDQVEDAVEAEPAAGKPAKVNVNTATAAEIAAAAKGIGKKTATDLIKHREANGPFATLDRLTDVGGISGATVAENADVLTV